MGYHDEGPFHRIWRWIKVDNNFFKVFFAAVAVILVLSVLNGIYG